MSDTKQEKTSKYAVNEKKPSKMFFKTLKSSGSSSVHCNCGRTHYAPANLYDSDDENDYQNMIDSALEEQKKDPTGVVIDFDNEFIYAYTLDNKIFVENCPCNGLRKYEEWMWNNRQIFRDYIKSRAAQEAIWANEETVLNKLSGII